MLGVLTMVLEATIRCFNPYSLLLATQCPLSFVPPPLLPGKAGKKPAAAAAQRWERLFAAHRGCRSVTDAAELLIGWCKG